MFERFANPAATLGLLHSGVLHISLVGFALSLPFYFFMRSRFAALGRMELTIVTTCAGCKQVSSLACMVTASHKARSCMM